MPKIPFLMRDVKASRETLVVAVVKAKCDKNASGTTLSWLGARGYSQGFRQHLAAGELPGPQRTAVNRDTQAQGEVTTSSGCNYLNRSPG